ncbi:TF-B3 domain-containing protein [Forsythia ovata]|uniref:TF-B3 domain-containing protein n=1 Tax=Forsythia ovata TaxID=205694 RepID=A0ABD1SIQ5_9LAMI
MAGLGPRLAQPMLHPCSCSHILVFFDHPVITQLVDQVDQILRSPFRERTTGGACIARECAWDCYWFSTKKATIFISFVSFLILEASKQPIPQVFADEYAHQQSDIVNVIDYSGINWEVQLERVNNKVFLSSGWENFVDYHTLENDFLLLFEYIGNSKFFVTIFNDSSMERTYKGMRDEEFYALGYPAFSITLEARLQGHRKIKAGAWLMPFKVST